LRAGITAPARIARKSKINRPCLMALDAGRNIFRKGLWGSRTKRPNSLGDISRDNSFPGRGSFACLAIASCRALARPMRMEKAGGYVSVQFAWSLPVAADKLRLKHSKKRSYRNECQMFRPAYDDLLMRNRFLRLLYVERLVFCPCAVAHTRIPT
jgi:hypothetical protein